MKTVAMKKANGKNTKKSVCQTAAGSAGRASGGGADRAGLPPGMFYLDDLDFAMETGGLWPDDGLLILSGQLPDCTGDKRADQRQHDPESGSSDVVAGLRASVKSSLALRTIAMIATVANYESMLTGTPGLPRFPRGLVAFDALEFSNISGGMTPEDALAILCGRVPEWVAELFSSHRKVDPHGDPRDFYFALDDLQNRVDCVRTALIFGTLYVMRRKVAIAKAAKPTGFIFGTLAAMRRKAAMGNADTAGATVTARA